MMKNKANIIKLLLISSFIVNLFIPKAIFSADMPDSLFQAIKCQSTVLYYASISALTLSIINKLIARELNLPMSKTEASKATQNQNKQKKDAASDFNIVTGQNNLMTKTVFSKFISPAGSMNIQNLTQEITLFQGIGSWLYIHCLLLLCIFFLLPRGAIDNYNILMPRYCN